MQLENSEKEKEYLAAFGLCLPPFSFLFLLSLLPLLLLLRLVHHHNYDLF